MTMGFLPGPVGETRRATSAKGTDLTSGTPVFIPFPDGTAYVFLTARNLSTAVVVQVQKCPWAMVLKTSDDLVAQANTTDYSGAAQDADTSTNVVLSALSTGALKSYVYVGSHVPFRGLAAVVANANATGSVLTAEYWNGSAWVSLAATDGTTSGGATMAISGNITWTVPAAWALGTLAGIEGAGLVPCAATKAYWVRLYVSVALGANVKLSRLLAMSRSTAYEELTAAAGVAAWTEEVRKGLGGCSGLEVDCDAGTGDIIVNVSTRAGFAFA